MWEVPQNPSLFPWGRRDIFPAICWQTVYILIVWHCLWLCFFFWATEGFKNLSPPFKMRRSDIQSQFCVTVQKIRSDPLGPMAGADTQGSPSCGEMEPHCPPCTCAHTSCPRHSFRPYHVALPLKGCLAPVTPALHPKVPLPMILISSMVPIMCHLFL